MYIIYEPRLIEFPKYVASLQGYYHYCLNAGCKPEIKWTSISNDVVAKSKHLGIQNPIYNSIREDQANVPN